LVPKETYFRIKRDPEKYKKLIDEIMWLNSLPDKIKRYFPKVLDYKIDGMRTFYKMPHYPFPTIRKMLLFNKVSGKQVYGILKNLMDIMFDEIYPLGKKDAPQAFAQNVHLKRITTRLKETKEKAKEYNMTKLLRILTCKSIKLKLNLENTEKEYENIEIVIKRLEKNEKILKKLQPDKIYLIHGDLHFGNILVKEEGNNAFLFKLIDPRGFKEGSDYTYDLGKIWHSFHGLYDFIHEKREKWYYLDESKLNFKGNNVEAELAIKKGIELEQYNYLYRSFPNILKKYAIVTEDENWEMRTLFAEASHFCSMIPFHLQSENRAIALYLMGVKLLNEFVNRSI
jgi:hypothetical protein